MRHRKIFYRLKTVDKNGSATNIRNSGTDVHFISFCDAIIGSLG